MLRASLLLAALFGPALLPAVTCTPVSATLCIGVDDEADVWINGQCAGTVCSNDFGFVAVGTSGPHCVPVNIAWLNPSGNYVAVRVRDTGGGEMWGTWALDVVCAGGYHSYITSNDSFDFYYDATGTAPPPLDSSSRDWFNPAYTPVAAWGAPSTSSGAIWGERASDPVTGTLLPPKSWTASGSGNGVNAMYFRQGFGLTPAPTPVPANLTLSVSQPLCNADGGTNFNVSFHVCNSGGNLTQTTSIDIDRGAEYSMNGPWSPVGYTIAASGTHSILTIPSIAGGGCTDYVITLVDYYVGPSEVGTVRSFPVILSYPGGTDSAGASIVAGPSCVYLSPTITRTFTQTPVALPTDTFTPTSVDTPTSTGTPTQTPLLPSATATPSQSPGPSATSTVTPSITQTFTPLPTAPPATATPAPLLLTPKYPNPSPASDYVFLPYVLTAAAEVDVRIYDVSGELLMDLGPLFQAAGPNERRWDLRNKAGKRVASGVYLCRIIANAPDGQTDEVWEKAAVTR